MFWTRTRSDHLEAAAEDLEAAATEADAAASEDVETRAAHDRLVALRDQAAAAAAAAEAARVRLAAAREAAGPALHGATERAKVRLTAARDAATPVVHDVVERAKPHVEAYQASLSEAVKPKVGAALASAAASLAHAGEHARVAAAPALEQALETAHVGNARARDALLVLRGEAVAKPVRRGGGRAKWLLGIGLLAALVAAFAAFRQKQQRADDPWATPLTDGAAQPSFKDKAVGTVSHAKEAVTEAASKAAEKGAGLAETAKEAAVGIAARGQAAVTEAKDRSAEGETAPDTQSSLDAALASPALDTGEVTAVEGMPGSDAVDGLGLDTGLDANAEAERAPLSGDSPIDVAGDKDRGDA
ncbi:MAG TPA: hypothetical protein VFJ94_00820 [Intrasporangium sp.]|uniref:hypothetical protein n=1 Tax=Intrasporangium sp. TaxID=1925024 RepID=UPI002D77F848|nr:hypothetical protein [Intrasporangium sp.]HET7397034.1 hypothetical protein [Intrasporangium sp.]